MKDKIIEILKETILVQEKSVLENMDKILNSVDEISKALEGGRKIFFFGNGGSAADAQHLAAEFIGRFQKERASLPALALTTDTSVITALSNDYSFDIIFARQIEGLGQPGDIAIGLSTSGNSKNVVEGMIKAKEMGLKTIALTGSSGGKLKELGDIVLRAESENTARIQEAHICIGHILCDLIERNF